MLVTGSKQSERTPLKFFYEVAGDINPRAADAESEGG